MLSINQEKKKVHSRSENIGSIASLQLSSVRYCKLVIPQQSIGHEHFKTFVQTSWFTYGKLGYYSATLRFYSASEDSTVFKHFWLHWWSFRSLNCWYNLYIASHNLLELNYAMSSCSYYFTSSNMSFPFI